MHPSIVVYIIYLHLDEPHPHTCCVDISISNEAYEPRPQQNPALYHFESGNAIEFPGDMQGFIQGGGGGGISPPATIPPPEILKLSIVIILAIYMLLNISMCHQNVWKFCPRLRQKQSERYTRSNFSWGGHAPRPP